MLNSEEMHNIIDIPISVSKGEILMMVLKYALFHNLSHSAVTNLFSLINCMFVRSFLPDTRYLIDKLFFSSSLVKYHALCPYCGAYVGTFVRQDKHKTCLLCKKQFNLNEMQFKDFYSTFNVANDIKAIIEDNDEYYHYVVNERVHEPGKYSDIYDGEKYKCFVESLDIEDRNRYVSLLFNTDGANAFNRFHSQNSVYPLHLIVNESPLDIRTSKTIVCGLWFGKGKPDMNVFLRSFVDEMNEYSRLGIPCLIRGETIIIKPYVIGCVVDSIARPPLQGVGQFNTPYGCNWCIQKGEWTPNAENTGGSVKYPFLHPLPKNRTKEHFEKCLNLLRDKRNPNDTLSIQYSTAVNHTLESDSVNVEEDEEAENTEGVIANSQKKDNCTYGVLHESPLTSLNRFDIVSSMIPDDMHFARLGIASQFTNYLFDKKSPLKENLTSLNAKEIDKILNNISAPHQAMRLTRSITDRHKWKAKEWENYILYYSLPVMQLFFEEKLVKHWALFVESFYIGLLPCISHNHLLRMEYLVKKFIIYAEKYYTKRSLTYNVHQLWHWIESLSNWGPSWAHNCFVFETGNGKLVRSINASKGASNQICRNISNEHCDRILSKTILPICTDKVKDYYLSLKKASTKHTCKISVARYFGIPRPVHKDWINRLGLTLNAVYYKRMVKGKCIFSTSGDANVRTNNSFAQLKSGTFIKIQNFIVDENLETEHVIYKVICTENFIQDQYSYLQKVKEISNTLMVAEVDELENICVFFKIRKVDYICPVPNLYYY
ncbi:uncharacterized protein LOC122504492 isoform X2 [Leptopilina heterotoma]|nr:uncharacterized protein LOC122504492 isoform X2 [Leptopilina heterotoma]